MTGTDRQPPSTTSARRIDLVNALVVAVAALGVLYALTSMEWASLVDPDGRRAFHDGPPDSLPQPYSHQPHSLRSSRSLAGDGPDGPSSVQN